MKDYAVLLTTLLELECYKDFQDFLISADPEDIGLLDLTRSERCQEHDEKIEAAWENLADFTDVLIEMTQFLIDNPDNDYLDEIPF